MRNGVRLRLCVMMFLQYAVWGAWGVSIGGYMDRVLGFDGKQVGALFSTTAVAAMISPLFVGYVADRLFATERILAFLHLAGSVLLFAAGFAVDFSWLYPIMQIYALCYMPTLALTNSISFANIEDSKRDFPGIRVWGTWGWIVSGWLIGFLISGTSNKQFFVAAGLSVLLAGYCLLLPHTPPKAKVARLEGGSLGPPPGTSPGVGVLRLLGDTTFLVFVICSFLICIPLSFYYAQANVFLEQLEAPYPTALQTIGQLSEVGFMAAMPFFIARLGVKRMLTVGMLAWVLRYLAFGTMFLSAVVFGLFLHGICYDFYFVASYIYVDTRVDEKQRASAQSFIAFVMLGLGMFVGSLAAGFTVDAYPPEARVRVRVVSNSSLVQSAGTPEIAQGVEKTVALPLWDREGNSPFAKTLGLKSDTRLTASMIPADYTETDERRGLVTHYGHDSFVEAVAKADRDGDGSVTREEWVIARRNQWPSIWLWPAMGALLTCVLFVIGFRDHIPSAGEERVGFGAVAENEP